MRLAALVVLLALVGCNEKQEVFGRLTSREPAYVYCYESNLTKERCFIGRNPSPDVPPVCIGRECFEGPRTWGTGE